MNGQFQLIADPGHAWLEVSLKDLEAVGLAPADFSAYSYKSARAYYLEEDCDLPRFIDAYTAKHGHPPRWNEHYAHQTFIRNLPGIHS